MSKNIASSFRLRVCHTVYALGNISGNNNYKLASQVVYEVVQRMVKKKMLDPNLRDQTRDLLLLHHSTLYTRQKRRAKTGQQLHIIRSLAEIGKRHSAKEVHKMSHVPSHSIVKSATNLGVDRMDPQAATASANDQHTPDNIESTQVPITILKTT
ncbi:unnamed protein product [Rodentolepis nana]|uniref:HTH_Tnp_Tc3_1 domain-containing protein n=1 Tax=Rodentolepis nana TaxID=102285 RepID=A0A0R3TSA4_RODNA|nr:unnamed protein product [Rodentolepis nana]